MMQRLFGHSVNYALVLLLLSLLVYSSIGLCLTVYPVSAETLPIEEENAVTSIGCRLSSRSGPGLPQIVP